MRPPSRAMPAAPPVHVPPWQRMLGNVVVAAVVGGYGYLVWRHSVAMLALTAGLVALTVADRRRMRRLIVARAAEGGICAFAHSFYCRRTDTRLIRAVYEELGNVLGDGRRPFPVRAGDRLFGRDGLDMDPEDVEEALCVAAARAGRCLQSTAGNPWFDKVDTAADLVRFLGAQPLLCAMPGVAP